MDWFSGFFSKYRRNVHFFTIILITVVFWLAGSIVNQYVSQLSLALLYRPFSKARHLFEEVYAVGEENKRLHLALVATSQRLTELEEIKRENIRLRSVLGFDPPPQFELVPAGIVSVLGSPYPTSAVINKGSRDSVTFNQTIINQDGLVGKIVSVTPDYATVQLLTDPKNRVAVRIGESREMGIVRFRPRGGGLSLENFPIQGTVKVGDIVVSSGLGGVYPQGLVVGTVKDVERPQDEPFCKILVEPVASFSSIEELFIMSAVN